MPPEPTKAEQPAARASNRRTMASMSASATATAPRKAVHVARPVQRRPSSVRRASAAAATEEEAPTNMRGLALRNVMAVCDSVSVASRFPGQSRCSAVAPDGTAWTGETDGSIAVRLAPSGMEVRHVEPFHRAMVLVLANVQGRMWAGYSDGSLRVFDYATLRVLHQSTQHTAAVYAMCAADGYVYTAGADWKVYQWEAADLHFTRMFHGHRNTVRCLTTYTEPEHGRRYLVSGSDDGTVKMWDASAAKPSATQERDAGCIATLECQGRCVLSVLVLEDTAELWVGSEDTTIRVWDLYSMTVTSVVTAHRAPVVALQLVEDTVWSGSKDGAIAVMSRFTKEVVHQAAQPAASGNSAVAQPRFSMSILPVTRTVVYNVWATAADGSWQCWHFTAPEGSSAAPRPADDADGFMDNHYLSHSRQRRRSEQASQRRARSGSRASATETNPQSSIARERSSGNAGEGEELRVSVARTRRSVAEMMADGCNNSNGSDDFAHRNEDVYVNAQPQQRRHGKGPRDARDESDTDEDDVPIDIVAESIRNDHKAETEREVRRQQVALAKETRKSAQLRAKLARLGRDPEAVAAEGVKSVAEAKIQAKAAATEQQSGATDGPTTRELADVSLAVELAKAQNRAMAAAVSASAPTTTPAA